MKRLFFGIEIPEAQKRYLQEVVREGRKRLRGVKWVEPECMHVTLKFLGNTPDALLADVVSAGRWASAGVGPMRLELGSVGAFPAPSKPRIVWVGLDGEKSRLGQLAEALEGHLEALGFEPEQRPYRAHVTVGRSSEKNSESALSALVSKVRCDSGCEFTVERFVLFSSQLTPTGPIYTPLAYIPLGNSESEATPE